MIGKTLGIYISFRFLRSLVGMLLGLAFLIISVDFIEQLRKAGGNDTVGLGELYLIAALRAPTFIEKAFPFACLFAAMMTLTNLNQKLELVVARAAGVSAWQFLLPIGIAAALVGVFVATVYNPIAIKASQSAKELSAMVLQGTPVDERITRREYWIKQEDAGGGYTVINAELARQQGTILDNAKVLRFDADGRLTVRLDATTVLHRGNNWVLTGVRKTDLQGNTVNLDIENLPTTLTKDELFGISGKPDEVSFWNLRQTAERVEKSGTNNKPYLVHFHSLMALPAFFFAMVLVAASVCLRFVRFGQVGRMILGGILFGFVLYTVTSLITALGSNGVIPPIVAAWSPGLVAILFGMSVLLHQEDG